MLKATLRCADLVWLACVSIALWDLGACSAHVGTPAGAGTQQQSTASVVDANALSSGDIACNGKACGVPCCPGSADPNSCANNAGWSCDNSNKCSLPSDANQCPSGTLSAASDSGVQMSSSATASGASDSGVDIACNGKPCGVHCCVGSADPNSCENNANFMCDN